MGILKGDVDIVGLGNLLQLLSMNKREGVLTLYKGMAKKTIHFGPQGIRLLSSNMRRINKLGKILLRRRRITQSDLDALIKEQKLLGWKLGQIAVTSGLVKKKDVEEALREQVEEEIFDMFMWAGAAFDFEEGKIPRDQANTPLAALAFEANMTSLVLEAARRADELLQIRTILDDEDMVLHRTPLDIHADRLADNLETADSILKLINGRHTLGDIINGSIYPRFLTMRALYHLFTLGYVKGQDRRGQPVRIAILRRPEKVR
jgi:hypothetical protein